MHLARNMVHIARCSFVSGMPVFCTYWLISVYAYYESICWFYSWSAKHTSPSSMQMISPQFKDIMNLPNWMRGNIRPFHPTPFSEISRCSCPTCGPMAASTGELFDYCCHHWAVDMKNNQFLFYINWIYWGINLLSKEPPRCTPG